ncbi:MAG: hypothetical protein MHPSP_000928, partial [Paramarteilia canceri]
NYDVMNVGIQIYKRRDHLEMSKKALRKSISKSDTLSQVSEQVDSTEISSVPSDLDETKYFVEVDKYVEKPVYVSRKLIT